MIYILVITVMLLLIVTLFMYKDLLSASFMSYSVFLFSIAVLIANSDSWNFSMNTNTFLVILYSLLIVGVGELLARAQHDVIRKDVTTVQKVNFRNLYFSRRLTYFVIVLMITYIFTYFFAIKEIASQFGDVRTFSNVLKYYNIANSKGYVVSGVFTMLSIGITSFCYLYIYSIIYNLIFKTKNEHSKLYIIPVILYFVILGISASRSNILYVLIYIVVIAYNLIRARFSSKDHSNKKVIKIFLPIIVVFFMTFFILGIFTGKSQRFSSAGEGISLYTSGSIVALNVYLESFDYSIDNFGAETMSGIRRIVSRLNRISVVETRHLKFVPITSDLRTNIYTSFRRYLNDYNFFGLFFIQFLVGYFFTHANIKIFKDTTRHREFVLVVYAYLYQAIIMQVIDEKLLTVIFTLTFLLQYFLFYVLYRLFVIVNET